METKYLQLDDIKIAYNEHGSGYNLLLLHGNSGSRNLFKKYQLKHFSNYHTYAIDSRGHGKSKSDDTEYSINQFSNDIINFCEKLGIKKTYVIRYSDGGNISLFLAKKHLEIFEKIITLSQNYLESGQTEHSYNVLSKMLKIFLFMEKLHFPMKKIIMRWVLMLKNIGITEDEIKEIKSNIFILYAENEMIKEEHILRIGELIKNCKIKKIMKSTHMNIYKNEETIKEIQKYFE